MCTTPHRGKARTSDSTGLFGRSGHKHPGRLLRGRGLIPNVETRPVERNSDSNPRNRNPNSSRNPNLTLTLTLTLTLVVTLVGTRVGLSLRSGSNIESCLYFYEVALSQT